jgi:cytidyltransferase-like protein
MRTVPAEMAAGQSPVFALAVYGGAFDPPHPGHESVIRRALRHAERVALVPSHRHAFGKRMADFHLRCRWLERLAARVDGLRVYCEPIEACLAPGDAAIYSIDLLDALQRCSGLPSTRIALLIGEDNEAQLERFERADELRRRYGRLVAGESIALHSSMIRQRLHLGLPLPEAWCLAEVKEELHCYARSIDEYR